MAPLIQAACIVVANVHMQASNSRRQTSNFLTIQESAIIFRNNRLRQEPKGSEYQMGKRIQREERSGTLVTAPTDGYFPNHIGGAFSDMSEMETDHGFTLCDPDGNALAAYVSSDDREVRHGLQFMQAATDEALGVMPPGPS